MTAFRYHAVDAQGKPKQGVIEADTARHARLQLKQRELYPTRVEAVSQTNVTQHRWLPWQQRISTAQLTLFTRQFATLLAAGLTVDAALSALIEQTDDAIMRQLLSGVRAEVVSGQTLARALAQYANIFPGIYRALIHAGEESGELAKVMLRLADYTENHNDLQQKILLALLYPLAVTLVAIAVIIGLMVYVVPQVVNVFQQTHQTLPLLTRALIALSDFLRHDGIYLLLALIASIWGARWTLSHAAYRLRWHETQLQLPLAGKLLRGLNAARFASTMAILVGSGVPLLKALDAGRQVVNNLIMRDAITHASRLVKEGAALSVALKASRQFPPLLIHLIASGESSGKLAHMLERAAQQQEQEMTHKTAWLTSLMEPLLIVVMGGIVLLIVLAIMLPIIDMNQMVH